MTTHKLMIQVTNDASDELRAALLSIAYAIAKECTPARVALNVEAFRATCEDENPTLEALTNLHAALDCLRMIERKSSLAPGLRAHAVKRLLAAHSCIQSIRDDAAIDWDHQLAKLLEEFANDIAKGVQS